MNNSIDHIVRRLLERHPGCKFIVNGHFECELITTFSQWEKDVNSPALVSKANVMVYDKNINEMCYGMIAVQHDKSLSNEYYAQLYLRDEEDKLWQHMHSICEISFK